MVKYYKKRPIVVAAVQWTGDNLDELLDWTGGHSFWEYSDDEKRNEDDPQATAAVYDELHSVWIPVRTEDFILRGTQGEYYPCRKDVFFSTYEEVTNV